MKTIFALLLLTSSAQAVTFKVIGPCSARPLYSVQTDVDTRSSVGEVTRQLLNARGIKFSEGVGGFESMMGRPTPAEAIETVSKDVQRAYGWCYSVNGKTPDVMSDDLSVASQNDEIVWFFASSTLAHGEWKNFCEPAYQSRPERFCGR